MLDFKPFKIAVSKQFGKMQGHQLYRVAIDKDALWDGYIASFPAGTNPIYRERTEHECSCCRQFVRAVGDVVAIIDGKIVSIWDGVVSEPTYNFVSQEMARLVKACPIDNIFLTTEASAGTDRSLEDLVNRVQTWEHFHVRIPSAYVCKGDQIGPRLSQRRADFDVLKRSLTELDLESTNTILELISQNSLYRGAEHTNTLQAFKKMQKGFIKLQERQASQAEKDAFVWAAVFEVHAAVSRIRNTSIGTLLIDLSEGLDLDQAVRKYEAVVAPANYKRPTALVTKSMVENAKKKIAELGLTSALQRRYATLEDIAINDILFADRSARKVIEGDVFDSLATKPTSTKTLDKVQEISIEKFLADIVPNADAIEVFLENKHSSHLVSLIAPDDPGALNMFKWDNNFTWSYNGDVTDSIKERVKKAGGNVEGDLCCRLSWFNYDDLDLHMMEPGGNHISFHSKSSPYTGGQLDVDMNAGSGGTREAVENIFYRSRAKMREGQYRLFVNQFCVRESMDQGFIVEIDYLGEVWSFSYPKGQRNGEDVTVAEFSYTHKDGIKITKSLPSSTVSRELWGLKTQEFQRVNVLMRSPNYWGERGTGNEHYFFMLDGCINDGQARGIYNEFLRDDLTPHRKVIEMVGAKMKTEQSENQLSGLGFSSTQRNELLVRVKGAFTRTLKIVF